METSNDCRILELDSFSSPATMYKEKTIGTAEIVKVKYKPGYYFMEGVRGYDLVHVRKQIPITLLKIKEKTWMVDDPLHWYGMQDLAKHSHGKVLVAGLGLGLLAHALVLNPKVESIDIFEINQDVIDLVIPLIPNDSKVRIYKKDIFDYEWASINYDTIIIDTWAGNRKDNPFIGEEITMVYGYCKSLTERNNSQIFIWGVRNKEINPAVTKDISKTCEEIARAMRL